MLGQSDTQPVARSCEHLREPQVLDDLVSNTPVTPDILVCGTLHEDILSVRHRVPLLLAPKGPPQLPPPQEEKGEELRLDEPFSEGAELRAAQKGNGGRLIPLECS